MTTQVIYLYDYNWLLKVFYLTDFNNPEVILDELDSIGCSSGILAQIQKMFDQEEYNRGFTYTDYNLHVTFVIIGNATNVTEFQNTLDHEKGHAATHIATFFEMDPYGEQLQYLQGLIGQKMFRKAKYFLCDSCRITEI